MSPEHLGRLFGEALGDALVHTLEVIAGATREPTQADFTLAADRD